MFKKRILGVGAVVLLVLAVASPAAANTRSNQAQPSAAAQWYCWFKGFTWNFTSAKVTVTSGSACANWQTEDAMRLYGKTASGSYVQIGYTGPGSYSNPITVHVTANCKGLSRTFKAVDNWSDGFLTYTETSIVGPKNC